MSSVAAAKTLALRKMKGLTLRSMNGLLTGQLDGGLMGWIGGVGIRTAEDDVKFVLIAPMASWPRATFNWNCSSRSNVTA